MAESHGDGVVALPGKDALSLVRLMRGLECLVREERLQERHCVALTGGPAPDADWQERLRTEVSAAVGLLEELLDGYDPSAVIAPAAPAAGAPRRGGG